MAVDVFEGDMQTTERVALNSKLDNRKLSDDQRQEMTEFAIMFDSMTRLGKECNAKHQSN